MADATMPLSAATGKFYVYVYRDPRPGRKNEPIYVGKGKAGTYRAERHWVKGTHNRCLDRMLRKIKDAGLEPVIEIVFWTDDEAKAFNKERELVTSYGRRDIKTGPLANVTSGGEGVSGWPSTDEYRAKKAEETRRRFATMPEDEKQVWLSRVRAATRSEEHRQRQSESHKGLKASQETIEKKRIASTGKRHTEETRKQLSEKARLRSPAVNAKISDALKAQVNDDYRMKMGARANKFWDSLTPEDRQAFVARRAAKIAAAKQKKSSP